MKVMVSALPGVSAAPAGKAASQVAAPQADFKATLQHIAMQTVNDIKAADAAAIAGIDRRMDTRKVVDAVMAAEHSLQTAIAVRDKVVSAYLDISRMQI